MRFLLLPMLACCSSTSAPSIELGTGTGGFQSLDEGAGLDLVYGPQGGWHVDVALRTVGLEADETSIVYTAEDDAGAVSFPAEMRLASNLVVATEDGWDRLGDRVVFDIDADTDVLGRTLQLTVEVVQGEERLSDTRAVRIDGP